MNNPNPFVPKGSLLEQQSQRRSRLKLAVFCVLAVSITGLVAMLIQGCKRESPDTNTPPPPDLSSNSLAMDNSNTPPPLDMSSNSAPVAPSNSVPMPPPMPAPTPPPPMAVEPVAGPGTDYVVVSGDTLGKIAKAHGVTVKALEAANPGVDPKKLKIKQKLTIPASTKSADAGSTSAAPMGATDMGGESYTVKSGDTLTKIAKKNGVSLKALKAANSLTTDHIKVGDKLKIPAKGETAAPAPTPDTTAMPALPPMPAPAPTPAPSPVPAGTPAH